MVAAVRGTRSRASVWSKRSVKSRTSAALAICRSETREDQVKTDGDGTVGYRARLPADCASLNISHFASPLCAFQCAG